MEYTLPQAMLQFHRVPDGGCPDSQFPRSTTMSLEHVRWLTLCVTPTMAKPQTKACVPCLIGDPPLDPGPAHAILAVRCCFCRQNLRKGQSRRRRTLATWSSKKTASQCWSRRAESGGNSNTASSPEDLQKSQVHCVAMCGNMWKDYHRL